MVAHHDDGQGLMKRGVYPMSVRKAPDTTATRVWAAPDFLCNTLLTGPDLRVLPQPGVMAC